ncbi:hypothetical protein HPB51_029406 [Rhipicephalus microplus]|uniref:THAP-type domain-containing protein n=1 Tax=Rhipicephalus microplus TaxID=6941 RepID=A0A9J6CUW7_RHIMP|nr:hypothetical protein HPB51_029406 [Rhipicephalus microplus]
MSKILLRIQEVPMDTSSSDDEAAGQASVSTDINGILRTDTLSSEDEQLSMSDEDGSEQHDPGELPSEDDMQQMPNSPTGPSHGGKSQFGELFTDVITERVVLSRGDILLMVLKHAVKNNLSFTGLTSMLDLINRIFEHPILPDSRYQLSKLLSKTGTTMTYYCFCPKCFTHIENAETNASFQCIQCGHRTSVSSLSDMPFFVTLDVESQLQRLLKDCALLDLTKPLHHDGSLGDLCDACSSPEQEILPPSVKYRRMMVNGSILTDCLYASKKKTNTSVVQLLDGSFAIIEKIISSVVQPIGPTSTPFGMPIGRPIGMHCSNGFPIGMSTQWCVNSGHDNLSECARQSLRRRGALLCEKHFRQSQFMAPKDGNDVNAPKQLLWNAIPTLFPLPLEPEASVAIVVMISRQGS